MSNEIEERICTTAELSDMLDSQSADVDTYTCTCGNQFSAEDVGASTMLCKCANCMDKLKQIIPDKIVVQEEVPEDGADEDTVVGERGDLTENEIELDEIVADVSNADSIVEENEQLDDAADVPEDATDEDVFFEELLGAMSLAVDDSSKTFSIEVNGAVETYKYVHDPVNGSRTRKLFTRLGCTIPLLYGYNCFGGMSVPANRKRPNQPTVFVLPMLATIATETGPDEIVLIHAIMETRCNRPRYDALITAVRTDKTSIVKSFQSAVQKLHPFALYDAAPLER